MSARDRAPADRAGADETTRIPRPPFRIGTRVLLPLLLVLTTAALLIGAAWRSLRPARPVQVVPVMVKTVQAAGGTTTVTASGWLEPDPFPIYASALTSGIVSEVSVLEGERVRKGDVIARLVAEDAQIDLRRAEAEVDLAGADALRARAERVAAEEVLETLIDRRSARATAASRLAEREADRDRLRETIAAEEATLAALRDEIARKKTLVDSGAVSEGEFRRLVLAGEAQERRVEAARRERAVLEARLEGARSDLEAAEEHLERTIEERAALEIARAGEARAQAELARASARRDAARLRLDRTEVRAPTGGVVLARLVSPGSRLVVGDEEHSGHVAHLYDPEALQVRVDVPLAEAAAVDIGQRALVEVQALPGRELGGRVSRVVHQADIQKNTVEVKVAVDDPSPVLKPEMLARVRFLAGDSEKRARQMAFVPEGLVREDAVWLVASRVGDEGVAKRRPITLGENRVESWREVTAGIRPGDLLVADPPPDLRDGERVTVTGEVPR